MVVMRNGCPPGQVKKAKRCHPADRRVLHKRVKRHIDRARELSRVRFPPIHVRIVPFERVGHDQYVLGVVDSLGLDGSDELCISEAMTGWSENTLKHVVFHELSHKLFGARHSGDPGDLMFHDIRHLPSDVIERDFVRLSRRSDYVLV